MTEFINKYIITWPYKDFLSNIYQEHYTCKKNLKTIHTHHHYRADKECQALR